jgi:outer membrane protein insertion porin family
MDVLKDDTLPPLRAAPPPLNPPLQNTSPSGAGSGPYAEEVKKIREWEKKRMEKKMRGEYETAVVLLSEVVSAKSSD